MALKHGGDLARSACLYFLGGQRDDIQGMNVRLHHVPQRSIDELMPLQEAQTCEVFGHHADAKVPFAFPCACVTDV